MKKIKLSEIVKVIEAINANSSDCTIEYVENDISYLDNKTVVFHLNKTTELNVSKLNKLYNCYIVTDQPLLKDLSIDKDKVLMVLNVNAAYKKFTTWYRNLFNIPVVAVTGTCGKSTTKEMIYQILKPIYNVVHTIGSKNADAFNHGLLLRMDDKTDYAVYETAILRPGDLLEVCEFFKPTIGVITTIGIDHLSGCKTFTNYLRTKAEMLPGLNYKGTIVINNDDENIKRINFDDFKGNIITFGIKNKSLYQAENLGYTDEGMTFTLIHKGQNYKAFVPGFGDHNVLNALAALAVVHSLGMNLEEAIRNLKFFEHLKSHTQIYKGINKSIIIDDTWSSNPTSMKAAIKVLSEKGKGKTKIAILGKINYLGESENYFYEDIAKVIVNSKIDYLITLDDSSKYIGKHAVKLGLSKDGHIHCEENNELITTLKKMLDEDTIALFKVSMLDKSHSNTLKDIIEE